jgi:transposase
MLTGMTERDWSTVLEVFDAAQSSRGEPGHNDRKFLEAIHYFTVHSIMWRALPREYVGTVFRSVWLARASSKGACRTTAPTLLTGRWLMGNR